MMISAVGRKKSTAASTHKLIEDAPLCAAAAIQRGPSTAAMLNNSTSQKPMARRNCDFGVRVSSAILPSCARCAGILVRRDPENHRFAFPLLELLCFAQSHHHIHRVQTVKALPEQVRAAAALGQHFGGNAFACKSAQDDIGRLNCNSVQVKSSTIVARDDQVPGSSLEDVICPPVALGPAHKLQVHEQIWNSHRDLLSLLASFLAPLIYTPR